MSLFLLQLWSELLKMFARKRTYLGFAVFLGAEILVLVLWQLPKSQQHMRHLIEQTGAIFEQYFSGITLATIMVSITIPLLGAVFLALVGGDLVAKEVEDGTMRMTLCRPVTRVRVLLLKYLAAVIYTFVLVAFIGGTALTAALLVRGQGGLFVMIPEEKLLVLYDFQPGLMRFAGMLPCFALSMLTVSTLSFLFSCMNIKPAAATISAVSIYLVDWILHFVPYFEVYRPYLMATHVGSWSNVFRSPIPWQQMIEDYAYLLGLDATLLVIAIVIFQQRDFKA